MHSGQHVFHQLTNALSRYQFNQCVGRYDGDQYVKSFPCWQQFLCLCFGQFTFRESLRSIVLCLNAHSKKLYNMGIVGSVKRSTLADANETRDWRIYETFAHTLIKRARKLYAKDVPFLEEIDGTFYALDSTTIDLCLSVFNWASFRETKAAVKLHTLLDLRGSIPTFIHVSDGKMHDVKILDTLTFEPGACYIMDRGYVDYARLYRIHQHQAFFIIRAKDNAVFTRLYSRPVDRTAGVICDQTVRMRTYTAAKKYPDTFRRVKYRDAQTGHTYIFLTNHHDLTALQIAELYRHRWDIEQFFKWIKGHLKIRTFWGTSANAVKTQIWVAVCAYLLVAIVRKQLGIDRSMYEILQILSVTMFEKTPMNTLFSEFSLNDIEPEVQKQLSLLNY